MKRRRFLQSGLSLAASAGLAPHAPAAAAGPRFVLPGDRAWPGASDWAALKSAVGGRLAPVEVPDLRDPRNAALVSDPFWIADQPGLTQSSGWLDAWRSSPSVFAVAAQSAADIAAAVRFAARHRLRLVVKGRGHSYLGNSNAPGSLLVWTRRMDDVVVHEAFTTRGSKSEPIPAVSCGAGAMWLHAYQAVTPGAGRYVQGGGCTTVGVAGLTLGGGFGSFSKTYGTAAQSLIEAEIVTADGAVRTVNADNDPDLFWAFKGGGGGAFGIAARLTLATHALPATFGVVRLAVRAESDAAFRDLLARFVDLYAERLFNPHWGEQARANPHNTFEVTMLFAGLTEAEARAAFAPLLAFIASKPRDYVEVAPFAAFAFPARMMWNAAALGRLPGAIVADPQPGAAPTDFWWSGNTDEVGAFWHAYTSSWLSATLLAPAARPSLAAAWFAASRHWSVTFHFNKGLAGAPSDVVAGARATAMNPDVADAFALAIIADNAPNLWTRPAPDLAAARGQAARVHAAMAALRKVAPAAGSYLNETDWFQADWTRAFWGDNYPRLLAIKRRVDPAGLYSVHHGVGSEETA